MLIVALLDQVVLLMISFYTFLLVFRVLLSWFRSIPWDNPVLAALSTITDPYLNFFRGVVPSLGGIDISPIFAFLALNVMNYLLRSSLYRMIAMG